jgi:hypothetical protein
MKRISSVFGALWKMALLAALVAGLIVLLQVAVRSPPQSAELPTPEASAEAPTSEPSQAAYPPPRAPTIELSFTPPAEIITLPGKRPDPFTSTPFPTRTPRPDGDGAAAPGSAREPRRHDLVCHHARPLKPGFPGLHYLYLSSRTGAPEIWTIRPDGSDLQQITTDGMLKADRITWSADVLK